MGRGFYYGVSNPNVTIVGTPNVAVTNTVNVLTHRNTTGRLGCYYVASPVTALTATADTATGGRWWLLNTSAALTVRLVECKFTCHVTNLVDLAAQVPVVTMERMSFTGAPSGATVTPAQRDTTDPAPVGTFRTANTGLTITTGPDIKSFIPVTLSVIGGLLAANTAAVAPYEQVFAPRDDSGDVILRQGEGIVWRQDTAGTANEERQVQADITWEEWTV